GTLGGMTAHYCPKSSPDQDMTTRQETVIDYEFLKSMKNAPAGFSMKDGLVKWSGFIGSDVPGLHKFVFSAAGYTKVWIDGKLILDKWRQCWNPNTYKFNLDMQPGKKYALKIEWIPDGDESFLALKYLTPYPSTEQSKLSLYSEMGNQIDYYFVHGNNLDQVISGYRFLTGRAPIVPKWAMGLWQSRQRYKTRDEILSVVKEFRQRNIPLDNIVLDWQYWRIDKWGDHEFDSARFSDPVGMLKDLHNNYHTQMMISVWPKFYEGTANYKLFDEKGWLYKQNIINRQKDWIGYISTFYDAFNPQARDLFWKLINEKLFSKGIDAWWLDATEPDILSNISVADRKSLMNPTYLGPATKVFNAFPLMNAKGVYEGQRKTNPDQRVFILTRSAYAGSQRYAAATWSGDIASRWHDMKDQIAAGLSFSVSGIPYWTMDIGGFSDETRYQNANETDLEEWRELNTRWFQFGAFCPLFRVHGEFPYREIYNIAPENHPAYQSMLYYDQLRYRMMPYLYSLAGLTYHKNYTIMRPLVMDFTTDTATINVKDEYMFGTGLLICPVYNYKARKRAVYLPSPGNWYELYSGKYFKGGQNIQADAPYSHIPVFVKEGSIIPFGPEIQYSTEKPADPVTLYVYTGHDASFSFYEDENLNYNYEKGKYSIIPISYNEKAKTLRIGKRQGLFPG
ncbi:MAG: glycoside hydrolase family 31 protein, partial [Bacteroidota bacterium]|nr:glycoside hydrolase family 31 protein [Bacteroidota bacterium]